jgi:signal transduction histidine kinase
MSDHDLDTLLDPVPGAAVAVTVDGRIVAGNDSSAVVFGRPLEELRGTRLADLVADGAIQPAILAEYATVTAELGLVDARADAPVLDGVVDDVRGPGTDGAAAPDSTAGSEEAGSGVESGFHVEVSRSEGETPTPYEARVTAPTDHRFDGTVWSLTDVSTGSRYGETVEALHQATRDLLAAESRRAVYERAGQAAHEVLGFPGVGVREYDPETERLEFVTFGARVGDIETRPAYDVEGTPHGRAFRRGETVVETIGDEDPLGREVFSQTMYVPIGDHGALSLGRIGSSFDDADRRFAEILAKNTESALRQLDDRETLREQRRELERRNERLEEFASIVSHDLRNPLSLAQGAFETYHETGEEAHAETVADAHDRMARIIDDVLAMARNERPVEDPDPVSLAAAAEDAWSNVATGDLSLDAADAVVEADRERLLRLLENLFRNTVEHGTAPGAGPDEGATAVVVEPTSDGFAVADDGAGFERPADQSVFDPGHTDASAGTGFGLAVVERIASAHGWSVTATAAEAGGARIRFDGVAVRDRGE